MDNQNQPRESMSRQDVDMPANNDELDDATYAGLGVNSEPDIRNPGSEEATDTVLHTDTITAQHAADEVPNAGDPANDLLDGEIADDDDKLDEEITELAEEDDEGNERY
ncbi:MAG: hypothetical protein H7319_07980 [Spirosoma sp.]|nr:hypothetical protein [Spirosoma sp.]